MSPIDCSLELIAPGLFDGVADDWAAPPSRSRLERLLSRGNRVEAPASTPLRNLLHRFGCDLSPDRTIPEGPLSLLGDGIDPGDGFWFCATPVSLQPDRDQLLLFDLQEHAPPQSMVDAIARQFNKHFEGQGWRLEAPQPMRWYLRSPQVLDVQTVAIGEVSGQSLDGKGPSGPDARMLRQVLTETEMLLHQLTTDTFGGRVQAFPANGLWVHGGGQLPKAGTARIDAIDSDEPLALGLAALTGVPLAPGMAGGRQGEIWQGRVLCYTSQIEQARQRGDRAQYLRVFDRVIGPICDIAEQLHGTSCIQITDGGRISWHLDGRTRKRWWRRTRPLTGGPS